MRGTGAAGVLTAAGAVVAAELAHRQASHRLLAVAAPTGPVALVVLGCPPRPDGTARALGRWRATMAVRAAATRDTGTVVFTGGSSDHRPAEAAVMAAYAVDRGLDPGLVHREEVSASTWENIAFALPFIDRSPAIAILSDPMHAARGRRILATQRPDLAPRLVSGGEYVAGEHPVLKVATAIHETTRAVLSYSRGYVRGRPVGHGYQLVEGGGKDAERRAGGGPDGGE
jgi:DUF218 domain